MAVPRVSLGETLVRASRRGEREERWPWTRRRSVRSATRCGGSCGRRCCPARTRSRSPTRFPADLRAAAAELGLFGYALPDEFGGSGVSMAQDVRLAFEFGYATPAFRSMFGTNNGIAGQVLAGFGTDAQKGVAARPGRRGRGRFVRAHRVRSGVQPGRAADSRDRGPGGGDWVVEGASGSSPTRPRPALFVVFARTDPPAGPGIAGFSFAGRGQPGADGRSARPQDGPARAWTAEVIFTRSGWAARPPDRPGRRGYRAR